MKDNAYAPAEVDPLVHARADSAKQLGIVVALAIAAAAAHAGAMGVISAASWVAGSGGDGPRKSERVAVTIVEPDPPPPPKKEPPPPPPPEVVPEVEAPKTVKPEPVAKPKRAKPTPRVAAKQPPPDPINQPKPTTEPAKPVRRSIGLNLESTVEGGDGPGFNTGNTRMGETSRIANDPNKIDRRKSAAPATPPPPPPSRNQVAAHIPGAKVKLVRPKRLARVKPTYPAVLRARNIEGTVVVRVRIEASGKVSKVDIVAAAKQPEFNAAARAAARSERFRPATKNGKAIPYSISFSYRFRLNDA